MPPNIPRDYAKSNLRWYHRLLNWVDTYNQHLLVTTAVVVYLATLYLLN